MQRPRAVAALPTAAAAALRAQAVISGPAEAVAELVANSLDAGAREVHVELDLAPGGLALAVRDDGTGLQAADLPLLGRRHATSKTLGSSAATAVGGAQVLGYRGEALAAICEAAAEVEVTSRAAGSFETHACLLRGSTMAQHGLALEQHGRQGTTVVVRDLFAAQPVRRKALATAGLQREADRCKEAAVRLALLRPDVTFTVFDRGRKAFLLRMLRGRGEAASIAEFLGQPAEEIARVAPVSGASYAISGYAALPPHGHPSSSRQCLYLNGRWVKAPPIAKLVDSLFQPLYKANMKLQQGQGEDLQRVHKAANRHAAFVLHISCPPSEYELSHEADGAVVHLRSWEPLLGCVRHALLAAWRLALSNSLLRELERLEGGEAGGTAEAGAAAGKQQQQQATEAAAGAGNGGRRGVSGGSGRQRTGAKHSLASRLVRYNAVTAWPQAAAADAAVPGQAASGERQQGHPWQQRLDSEEEVNRLINSWSSASQRRQEQGQQQQQEQQQQRWQDDEEEPLQGHWEQQAERRTAAGWQQEISEQQRQQQQQQPTDHLQQSKRGPSAAAPAVATAGAVNASNSAILTLEALAAASFARLAPGMLSREQLATGRALHQVDQKFVPLLAGPLLALVDQHAADERVRLERLRDELLGPDGQPQRIASQALRTPLPLGLTDAEQQLLEAYRDRVEAWGWRWLPGLAGPLLSHAPLLWGTTLTATDLKLYLHHLHDTCGAGGMPAGVLRVLNSKACRSAVMFGDELDQGQCQALLDSLAATQLCFSCAHGRPTTAPVVNLQLLRHALQLRQAAQLPAAAGEGGGGGDAGGRVELSGLKAKLQRLQG
ncbi:hypothetical protein ABPG75_003739 [Micractinium tetrahymenae]